MSINALTLDIKEDGWEESKGFIMRQMPMPVLDENLNEADKNCVILKIKYAGVCGSDKGIWNRAAFKDLIHSSLQKESKTTRILGHEFLGEIIEMGSEANNDRDQKVKIGDLVSGDSHVTCGECYQCKIGQNNVCTNELILGISTDGVFAEYVKMPAKNLFLIENNLIRPEIAAILDPFGNAMHTISKFNPQGKSIAVFGVGPIGLFIVGILKSLSAAKIIAIDINEDNLKMAKEMGADETLIVNENTVESILELTGGIGVDVAMEMAGPNSSVINCLESVRRGGEVVLFGLKDGDFMIPQFSKYIVKGVTMHGIIGRQIFKTWHESVKILSDKSNGLQEKIWKIILKEGSGTIINFADYNKENFGELLNKHPKIIFKI